MTWSRFYRDPAGVLWEAVSTRGVRLTFYVLLTAALFPSSRFILLAVLVVILGIMWTRDYAKSASRRIFYLAGAVLLVAVAYGFARTNVVEVDQKRLAMRPYGPGISQVRDGTYTGTGKGFRGPIAVRVAVQDHRIVGLDTLEYPDAISVLDNDVASLKQTILDKGYLVLPQQPQMYRGAQATLTGYANAIESALSKGIPDYPRYSAFSSAFFDGLIGEWPGRVTLNTLAILFAAFAVFEYALQSMLTPGTGRSINCYNCASCVGVCPVKEAEGIQIPMGLVLLTRLGDYERVTELSKYCVGCGRCAAKCPIGNSGPLVISAAFQAIHERRKEEERLRREEEMS